MQGSPLVSLSMLQSGLVAEGEEGVAPGEQQAPPKADDGHLDTPLHKARSRCVDKDCCAHLSGHESHLLATINYGFMASSGQSRALCVSKFVACLLVYVLSALTPSQHNFLPARLCWLSLSS